MYPANLAVPSTFKSPFAGILTFPNEPVEVHEPLISPLAVMFPLASILNLSLPEV